MLILQFIEQIISINALKLAIFHQAKLAEGVVNLGKRMLLARWRRVSHLGFTIRLAHLSNHL